MLLLKKLAEKMRNSQFFLLFFLGMMLFTLPTLLVGKVASKWWGNQGSLLLNKTEKSDSTNQESLELAELMFRRSIKYNNNPNAWFHLGSILSKKNEEEAALNAYQLAGLNSDDFLEWGKYAWGQEDYQTSLIWFRNATILDSDQPEPHYWIGRIYNLQGNPEQALQSLEKTIAVDPYNRDSWYEIGQTYVLLEDWSRALNAFERGVQLKTNYIGVGKSNFFYEIGRIQQNELTPPDLENAWLAYRKAIQLDDYSIKLWQIAGTYFQRGRLLATKGHWNLAITEFEHALSINPKAYSTLITYARALRELDRYEEAKSILIEAIKLQPRNDQAILLLGNYYFWDNEIEKARATYLRALEVNPNNIIIQNKLNALEQIEQ